MSLLSLTRGQNQVRWLPPSSPSTLLSTLTRAWPRYSGRVLATANRPPAGSRGEDEGKGESDWWKGPRVKCDCRQLHYLLTMGITHIHPPARSLHPTTESGGRGEDYTEGLEDGGGWRRMEEDGCAWKRTENREKKKAKGVIKRGWGIYFRPPFKKLPSTKIWHGLKK